MDLVQWVVEILRHNPELAIFLTLGIGYWLGGLEFKGFSLGAVTGVLLVGVLVGQLDIEISSQVKSVFFIMFLFAVGYGVGPQFVQGLARDGGPQALFAVLICLLCLGANYLAARIQGYDLGYAAGLFSGSQTISASIGLATDAIRNAGLSAEETKKALDHIPVAYAVTYLWGTLGTGMILARVAPALLRIDLVKECERYEAEMGGGPNATDGRSAWHQVEMRAYRVKPGGMAAGKSVADAERHVGERVFIERLRRAGHVVDFGPETVIQPGDVVAVSGRREVLVGFAERGAEEVEDRELLDVPAESVNLVVTKKDVAGHTIEELGQRDFARGVFLGKITRGLSSVEIPVLPKTRVMRGDVLTVTGTQGHTQAVEQAVGYADRPTQSTDMVWVGIAIVLGGLFGAIVIPIGGVPITLSTSGGALIAGLIMGWLRSVHPTFGRVPAGALWFMNSVGLNTFIAVVGISSGVGFVSGLQAAGVSLFLWGLFATSVPMLLAPLIGKYLFHFDPAINLGCCGGARTSTASVGMVGEAAKSNVPMLGYTVPYAVSNTLLTLWGLVIVLLLQ